MEKKAKASAVNPYKAPPHDALGLKIGRAYWELVAYRVLVVVLSIYPAAFLLMTAVRPDWLLPAWMLTSAPVLISRLGFFIFGHAVYVLVLSRLLFHERAAARRLQTLIRASRV